MCNRARTNRSRSVSHNPSIHNPHALTTFHRCLCLFRRDAIACTHLALPANSAHVTNASAITLSWHRPAALVPTSRNRPYLRPSRTQAWNPLRLPPSLRRSPARTLTRSTPAFQAALAAQRRNIHPHNARTHRRTAPRCTTPVKCLVRLLLSAAASPCPASCVCVCVFGGRERVGGHRRDRAHERES